MQRGKNDALVASVLDDRGFVAQLDSKKSLSVAALDLATNKPAWPQARKLGRFFDLEGIFAANNALVIFGEVKEYSNGLSHRKLFVLDPATGETKWEAEYGGEDDLDLQFFPAAIAVVSNDEAVTKGLDWQTGAVKWSIAPIDPIHTNIMDAVHDEKPVTTSTSSHLVLSGAEGLRSYDANTGVLQQSLPDVDEDAFKGFVNNRIVLASGGDGMPHVLSSFDPSAAIQPATPQLMYQAPDRAWIVDDVVACGGQQLCFVELERDKDS